MLFEIYSRLLERFGPQGWWPQGFGFSPPEWEVCVGAVLTQNTSWENVEKALENLRDAGIVSRKDIFEADEKYLAELIRPSGYFNQKARKLKVLADIREPPGREELLSAWGIGSETADSILLYAYKRPYFVIDAYTRRIFSRVGLLDKNMPYEDMRKHFEDSLPKDAQLYNEFHALIVRLAKEHCMKKPGCAGCPLENICKKSL